jgi:hypothetical protein
MNAIPLLKRGGAGRRRRAQGGSVLMETYIVLPVFALLLGGIFELSMLYRARAILDAATFEAAQQGAMHNARMERIRVGLAQGMTPHLMRDRGPVALGAAYARAMVRVSTPGAGVRIVSPNRDAFRQFRQRQTVQTSADNSERGQFVIPNDNLLWRDATVRQVRVGSDRIPMTVQDANLLKVESHWCEKLLVPVLDRVIAGVVNWPLGNPPQCATLAAVTGDRYVLLRSSSVARMQSPILEADLPN